MIATFKNDNNVTFLWDPDTINKQLLEYWGFVDVNQNYNIFHKSDVVVPFKHNYAKEYYEISAYSKEEAINLIKNNGVKYAIN